MSTGLGIILILLNKKLGFFDLISKNKIIEMLFKSKLRLLLSCISILIALYTPIFIMIVIGSNIRVLKTMIHILIGILYGLAYSQAKARNFYN